MVRSTHRPAIVLVDDDRSTLLFLSHYLGWLAPAYDILPAVDAQSALRHVAERTVALLITDYRLPDMNGLQLTTAVKTASPLTHVILASADDSSELKQRARDHQVDTFLYKLDSLEYLEDVVRTILPAVPADE
jgi:CheY-like chemotaxis protein